MFEQAVLGFCISLEETFSNVIISTVTNKYFKGGVVQIAAMFRSICHVVCGRVL